MHRDAFTSIFTAAIWLVWGGFALAWFVARSGLAGDLRRRWRSSRRLTRVASIATVIALAVYGGGKGAGGGDRGASYIIPRPPPALQQGGDPGATNAPAFRWTSFAIDGDEFQFSVEWPATNLADYAAIDVFHKRHLDDPAWRWIHRETVWDPEELVAEFSVYGDELPYWECETTWGIETNEYEVAAPFGVVYTNLVAYVENTSEPSSGFFLAANQHDTDGDGAPDAVEQSLGLDPLDPGISSVGSLGIGAATRAAASASSSVSDSSVLVSRWGRSGLKSGDWVMKGKASRFNYLLSGKWQPSWMPGKNIPAGFSSGNEFSVPATSLRHPTGWDVLKTPLGQRIYVGPTVGN